jgi:predicted AAA+ superfamily ATPase
MVMDKKWYKIKGYKKNPLHIEPNFGDIIIGHDVLLDELSYRIDAGSIVFLEGNIGKTAILSKLIEKYKGNGKVAYVNCENVKDEPDIKVLVSNGKKKLSRHLKKFPSNLIILLDNIHFLSNSNAEKIKHYFDNNNILSIIMTADDYSKVSIPDSLKHRIGGRIYKIRDLTIDEDVDIILERLNFPEFITENLIFTIAKHTKNIKELLKECDSALFVMANQDEENLSKSIVNNIIHEKTK